MEWRTRALCAWVLGLAACSDGRDAAPPSLSVRTAPTAPVAQPGYLAEIEEWRRKRVAELRAPEGWLSYTGSGRLRPGHYRVGNAADNDIALPGGPPRLGLLTLENDQVRFEAAHGVEVRLRGQAVGALRLTPEEVGRKADRLDIGQAQFYVVRTGPVFGWRFRDPDAPARRDFAGLEYFPVDSQWRVRARWHRYAQPKAVTLLTSIGTPLQAWIPGEAVFRRDGREFRLRPIAQPRKGRLFFIFADRTSGKETYGGARYLAVETPRGEDVVLDFNRAENPPCALTPHLVCPIAPPDNRLDLAISAGEKTYIAR